MICAVTWGARPERRLVEQQQPGPADQGPAEREHLPLAAGELVTGVPLRRRASGSNSSYTSASGPPGVGLVRAPQPAEPQVLVDGQLGDHAAALGHVRDAPAARAARPGRRAGRRRRRRSGRAVGRTRPDSVRSRVVLPAPLAPSTAVMVPAAHGQVDVVAAPARRRSRRSARRTLSSAASAVMPPPRRRSRPGRPRRPPGRRGSRRACRRRSRRPKSSTTISSQTAITRSMWCSTSSTAHGVGAAGQFADQRRRARRCPRRRGRRPARRAAAAAARATSARASATRLRTAYGSVARAGAGVVGDAAVRPARSARRSRSRRSSRSLRGSPNSAEAKPAGPRVVGADHHVLQHGQAGEQADALQGAGDAEAGQPVRAGPQRLAVEGQRAGRSAATNPQTTLNRVVLPAPLGPMTPTTRPGGHPQRDVVEGDQAAEAHPDAVQCEPVLRHRHPSIDARSNDTRSACFRNSPSTSSMYSCYLPVIPRPRIGQPGRSASTARAVRCRSLHQGRPPRLGGSLWI